MIICQIKKDIYRYRGLVQFGLESSGEGKHQSVKLGCSVQSDLGRENLNAVY